MYYVALATDYDGTLATDGRVDDETRAALERLRDSGRKLILVTGRQLDDLERVFPHLDLFERIVAENGALLYRPADRGETLLAERPPEAFTERLRERGVQPLSIGRAIVATWEPNEKIVLETIQALGLELQITFNKGAVMVLPPGVNKASGLAAALREMGLSAHNVVGVGDAENDHAFLHACGCAVAVGNALDTLKAEADIVTVAPRGAGVAELIDGLLADDLGDMRVAREEIPLCIDADGRNVCLRPHGGNLLLTGSSGGGKSTATTAFLEQLIERHYQFCVIDPEGDYEAFDDAIIIGNADRPPDTSRLLDLLQRPDRNIIVNMLSIPLADRPDAFVDLLLEIQQMRVPWARPHWIVVDEAHHMMPATRGPATAGLPEELNGLVLVTADPVQIVPEILARMTAVVAVGAFAGKTIDAFCNATGMEPPVTAAQPRDRGEALLWYPGATEAPRLVRTVQPRGQHKRHIRKYAEGKLGEDKSFYFRGPQNSLNLRAHNLEMFVQMAAGVDESTWMHHLRAGDYSRWFRESIKDDALATLAATAEARDDLDAAESRAMIQRAIEERYTGPAG